MRFGVVLKWFGVVLDFWGVSMVRKDIDELM